MGINVGKYFIGLWVVLVTMPIGVLGASAKSSPRTRSLNRDIESISRILAQNKLKQKDVDEEVANVEYQVAAAKRVIEIIEGAEKVSTYELSKLQNQLIAIEREHEMALSQYQVILVEEYKNRDYRTKLYFLASSNGFGDFINRLSYLEKLKEFRKKQVAAIENKKKEILDKLAVYKGSSEEKAKISKMKTDELNLLNSLLNEKHTVLNQLEAKTNELQLELNAAQSKLNKSAGLKQTEMNPATSASAKRIAKMIWPLKQGLVVSRFGVHKHSKERKVKVENNGIDILAEKDEPVRCVANGEIRAILQIPGSNTTLIIDHGTHYSVYSNISAATFAVGDKVGKETLLGKVAEDEQGTYKLHFEVWQGTKKLNPEDYLLGSLN